MCFAVIKDVWRELREGFNLLADVARVAMKLSLLLVAFALSNDRTIAEASTSTNASPEDLADAHRLRQKAMAVGMSFSLP
jgi:hypothetical protein